MDENLKAMYDYFLDLASKGIEKVPVSPELIITLIEKFTDLETDCHNLESYVHVNCHNKNQSHV